MLLFSWRVVLTLKISAQLSRSGFEVVSLLCFARCYEMFFTLDRTDSLLASWSRRTIATAPKTAKPDLQKAKSIWALMRRKDTFSCATDFHV